ncbi:MAG: putative lipid II flippase FtsW [Acidobacteria bacterium]|nr:putative lipid II flippase FtsW [Acidobacteriota bacterium]
MPRSVQPDRWLFSVTVALCLIGAVMVFSASAVMARETYGNGYTFLLRQLAFLTVGFGGMFALMNLDYRKLREPAVVFTSLAVVLVLLIAVFFLDKNHATHRWIRLGPVGVQPSELAKLAVVLYLAWFLEMRGKTKFETRNSKFERQTKSAGLKPGATGAQTKIQRRLEAGGTGGVNDLLGTLLPAMGPVLLFVGLVVLQPDLGTSVDIFMIALAMLFVAGLSPKYFAGAIAAALPAIYLLIVRVPYRYQRLMGFLNPESDPQGSGFQMLQSLIAVGSGGFAGVGLMGSRQKLFYLPEAHTDFIYAVLCEELGFIGGLAVLVLFGIYAWRGVRAALAAPDDFGRYLAMGITVMVVGQALINLSVVLGMMPTKGIPLPFMSYGGSSLVVMLLATGILLNISQQAE